MRPVLSRGDCRFALFSPSSPDGHSFDLLVEAKRRLSVLQVAVELLPRLRANAAGAVLTLACPFISPRVAAMCRESNVSYFDADGTCLLSAAPTFCCTSREGLANTFRSPKGPPIFMPKSSRIVRMLLSSPQRPWGVLELAKKAAISNVRLASRVKDAPLKEAFIEESARRHSRAKTAGTSGSGGRARHEPAGANVFLLPDGNPARGGETRHRLVRA